MSERNSKVYSILSGLNKMKWRIALKGIITGVIAGILVVLYRLGIEYGTETAFLVYKALKIHPIYIIPWIILLVLAGYIIARLVKFEPMASGSGIPQVEGQAIYGLKVKYYTVLFVRFAGGLLASFFGLSLGREGPSIQIGASGAQAVAKRISNNKMEENYLITGGAAAGLSAAFNAPLSGMVFALEEVHRSFSAPILLAATTASLTADVLSKLVFGLKPVLSFVPVPQLPVRFYLWLIPLGIVSGLAGSLINKLLLSFQSFYKKLPWFIRPTVALLLALPCGLFLPQVLGGGQNLIQLVENGEGGILVLTSIFAVKLIFTCVCFGSGTPGGIFLPILSVGALAGGIVGQIAVHFGMPAEYLPCFAVCAMAGGLSGSVKAPVTSILLPAEMTGSLVHLLPVAACSFIALLISDVLKVTPIYEALLERIVSDESAETAGRKQSCILEVPVELGSEASDKLIGEVNWPQGVLIAGIHRGDKEIIPNGRTKMSPGDYLIVLASELSYKELSLKVRELCQANY